MPVSHVTYTFQSESTLHSCLNVKELLAWSMHEIWSLSDCNWAQTHIYLVRKQTLNHLAKLTSLAKWLSVHLWTKWMWVQVQLQSIKVTPPPLPCQLQSPPPFLFLLPCFVGWMGDCATFHALFYLIILWVYKCWVLLLRVFPTGGMGAVPPPAKNLLIHPLNHLEKFHTSRLPLQLKVNFPH